MPDVFKVSRAQIWFWDDPTYGKKSQKKIQPTDIPFGERALHYSRYVLVLQYPETAIGDSNEIHTILVAPLSTSVFDLSTYDVPIHIYQDGPQSYVKISRMFSASPIQLTQFIGTVSNDIMQQVDESIRHMILDGPFTADLMRMENHCTEISNVKDTPVDEEAPSASSELHQAAKALPYPVTSIDTNPVEEVVEKKPLWDEERIKDFLKVYTEEGSSAAAEKFSLKESTTKTYFNKWIKKYPRESDETEVISVDDLLTRRQALADRIIHLDNETIRKSLNTFSHMIKRYMEAADIYGRLVYDNAFVTKVAKKEFYELIQLRIFWDTATKAGIVHDKNQEEFIPPEIDASTEELPLLYFLDSIISNNSILIARTSDVCIERFYKLKKEEDVELDESLAIHLHSGLLKKLRLTTSGQDILYRHICGALAM